MLENITTNVAITTKELWEHGNIKPQCPFCNSFDLVYKDSQTTTLGHVAGADPNHFWHAMLCNTCKHEFTFEHKHNFDGLTYLWYTIWNNKELCPFVLAGISGCYEDYTYPCKCGGRINRYFTKLDGVTQTRCLSFAHGKRCYRTFYECDTCHTKLEVDEE